LSAPSSEIILYLQKRIGWLVQPNFIFEDQSKKKLLDRNIADSTIIALTPTYRKHTKFSAISRGRFCYEGGGRIYRARSFEAEILSTYVNYFGQLK
jgi:hypothetical protein